MKVSDFKRQHNFRQNSGSPWCCSHCAFEVSEVRKSDKYLSGTEVVYKCSANKPSFIVHDNTTCGYYDPQKQEVSYA